MDRFEALIDRVYTNNTTRNDYKSRLRMLVSKLDAPILDILTNPETYYSKLQAVYPSLTTRKNILTVILVLYREDKDMQIKYATEYERWKKLHDDLARLQDAKVKRSEPDDKQIAQYTSYEEIESKYELLKKRSYHDSERHSMQYVLLSILVHLRPKRADLGSLHIYYEKDPRRTDMNYIVLRAKGTSYLVMNMYKTSQYYQTVEEDMPDRLVKDIQTSLSRWPREYIFRKDDGEPMSNNTYSAFVKSTFRDFFGRATGVSMLRHIYITEKVNYEDMTLQEQEDTAKLMLHTSGLQRKYKWSKKAICPKLCGAYIPIVHKTRKIKRKKVHPKE